MGDIKRSIRAILVENSQRSIQGGQERLVASQIDEFTATKHQITPKGLTRILTSLSSLFCLSLLQSTVKPQKRAVLTWSYGDRHTP
ncbi:hypothetical protein OK016_21485 [Vibrio chagasii]|nr:hypothetical protein [Vibrio chagasii]